MPSIITSAILGAINNGLQLTYNSQLYRAESVWKGFCFDSTSTGQDEVYPALDMIAGPREWLGPRLVQSLSQHTFTIKNKKFEQTIGVRREHIEDDKYGIYTPVAAEMGNSAAQFPDKLVADLIKLGTTTATYDGQNFFDLAHPNWDAGGAAITLPNYTSGANPGWYLIDNSRFLKPFILQTRVPFNLVTRFNPDDPSVFDNDEFLWGTRGRMNAGFGMWQLCYYSKAAMTQANLIAARTAMAAIRRPDGTPMGITPDTLVVPSALYSKANSFWRNQNVVNDTDGLTLVENQINGWFKPIEFKWLN